MASTPGSEHRSLTALLKALLARRVVDGGDSGWWQALIPVLAIIAVLFAALQVRSAAEDADRALVRAADARELATSVDRLALIGSTELGERGNARALQAARSRVRAETEALTGEGLAADVAAQAALADQALEEATTRGATRAERRRAEATLDGLQPAARSFSDRAEAASARADDRASKHLTWTLVGVLVLVALLLGSFWSRRNAADAQRRERRFRALLRNSSDLVVVVDPDTLSIRYATPAVERMLGYRPEAVLGSSLAQLTHPDDRDALTEASLAVRASEDGHETDRWRALHHGGGSVDVEASWLDLTDDTSVQGLVVTIRDVGERARPRGPAAPPGLPRPADRAAQPLAVRGPRASRGRAHPPPRPRHGGPVRGPGRLQDRERLARPRRRRRAAAPGRRAAGRLGAQLGHRRPPGRRRVRRPGRGARGPRRGAIRSPTASTQGSSSRSSSTATSCSAAPAWASPPPSRAPPARSSCATPTPRCTPPRPRARAGPRSSGPPCTWRSSAGCSSAATCAARWTTASCTCSTSRSSTCPRAGCWARRRWPAGPTRRWARCRPRTSSRWPRRPA